MIQILLKATKKILVYSMAVALLLQCPALFVQADQTTASSSKPDKSNPPRAISSELYFGRAQNKLAPESRWNRWKTFWKNSNNKLDEKQLPGFIYASEKLQEAVERNVNDPDFDGKILKAADEVNAQLRAWGSELSITIPEDGQVPRLPLKKDVTAGGGEMSVPYLLFQFGSSAVEQRAVLFNVAARQLDSDSLEAIGVKNEEDEVWLDYPGSEKTWIANAQTIHAFVGQEDLNGWLSLGWIGAFFRDYVSSLPENGKKDYRARYEEWLADPGKLRELIGQKTGWCRKIQPLRLDTVVSLQRSDVSLGINELIANGLDATLKGLNLWDHLIGQFGEGFFLILKELEESANPNDRVIVTTSQDGKSAIQAEFRRAGDKYYVKFSAAAASGKGTRVRLRRGDFANKMLVDGAAVTRQVLRDQKIREAFSYNLAMPVVMNGKETVNALDNFRGMKELFDRKPEYLTPKTSVRVVTLPDGYEVVDQGIGMDARTFFEQLLVPHISSHEREQPAKKEKLKEDTLKEQIRFYYLAPEKPDELVDCEIVLQVAGVGNERLRIRGINIPRKMVIQLPRWTSVGGVGRNKIVIDALAVQAFQFIVDQALSLRSGQEQDILINGLAGLAREKQRLDKEMGGVKPEDDLSRYIFEKVSGRNKGGKDRMILPNKEEFLGFVAPARSAVRFLDEDTFRFRPGETPGIEALSSYRVFQRQLFLADFDSSGRIYQEWGNYLFLDKKLWREAEAKDKALKEKGKPPEYLENLIRHIEHNMSFYIGYGPKPERVRFEKVPLPAQMPEPEQREDKQDLPGMAHQLVFSCADPQMHELEPRVLKELERSADPKTRAREIKAFLGTLDELLGIVRPYLEDISWPDLLFAGRTASMSPEDLRAIEELRKRQAEVEYLEKLPQSLLDQISRIESRPDWDYLSSIVSPAMMQGVKTVLARLVVALKILPNPLKIHSFGISDLQSFEVLRKNQLVLKNTLGEFSKASADISELQTIFGESGDVYRVVPEFKVSLDNMAEYLNKYKTYLENCPWPYPPSDFWTDSLCMDDFHSFKELRARQVEIKKLMAELDECIGYEFNNGRNVEARRTLILNLAHLNLWHFDLHQISRFLPFIDGRVLRLLTPDILSSWHEAVGNESLENIRQFARFFNLAAPVLESSEQLARYSERWQRIFSRYRKHSRALLKLLEETYPYQGKIPPLPAKTVSTAHTEPDWENPKLLPAFKISNDYSQPLCCSKDGKYILSVDDHMYNYIVKIWKREGAGEYKELQTFTYNLRPHIWQFSPDGNYLLLSPKEGGIMVMARGTDDKFKELRILGRNTGKITSCIFSPDGKYIVSGHDDGMARLWEIDTGMILRTLKGGIVKVYDAQFSPDGRYIATVSGGDARIFEAATGKELRRLTHAIKVSSVCFSPDGKHIVTVMASYNSAVSVWETVTGKKIRSFAPIYSDYGDDHDVYFNVKISHDGML